MINPFSIPKLIHSVFLHIVVTTFIGMTFETAFAEKLSWGIYIIYFLFAIDLVLTLLTGKILDKHLVTY